MSLLFVAETPPPPYCRSSSDMLKPEGKSGERDGDVGYTVYTIHTLGELILATVKAVRMGIAHVSMAPHFYRTHTLHCDTSLFSIRAACEKVNTHALCPRAKIHTVFGFSIEPLRFSFVLFSFRRVVRPSSLGSVPSGFFSSEASININGFLMK